MISARLAGRLWRPIAACLSAAVLFTLGACSSSDSTSHARAEDAKSAAVDPDFAVPDGTPEKIFAFVKKLQNRQKEFATRQEFVDDQVKSQRAIAEAGAKLLGQKISDKIAVDAVQMNLGSLLTLSINEVEGAPKEALDSVTRLKGDDREAVAKAANEFWLPIRIVNSRAANEEDRKALAAEVVAAVGASKFSKQSINAVALMGDILVQAGHPEEAAQMMEQLAKVSADASDPKFHPNADLFNAIARRMRLQGNFMELEGKLVDGSDFDWASYRGKVVLVDFWATWCGPCIAELPNVKEVYKKYHEKGFDVVGISLDHVRQSLENFVKKEEIPWAQLYDEEKQRGKGWNCPMALKYGVSGIPLAILVDKEGKVVSMRARGEELEQLVAKQLGE
jgi:thiol-disulfide isomerase/thioredoxin